LGISKHESYLEENKRAFQEIGPKGNLCKRMIMGLNTKDFEGELEIISIKRRLHLFLIKMKEQRLQI
jgi:hypothetical protein